MIFQAKGIALSRFLGRLGIALLGEWKEAYLAAKIGRTGWYRTVQSVWTLS